MAAVQGILFARETKKWMFGRLVSALRLSQHEALQMVATYVIAWPCVLLSARDDVGRTNENTAIAIDVLGNDVGSGLRPQKITGGAAQIGDVIAQIKTAYGLVQLTLGANNQVTFDPGTNFNSLQAGQTVSFQGTYRVG